MRVSDTTIVVTGGGDGLGAEMTRAFAAEGADVGVGDVDDDGMAAVVESTADAPGTVRAVHTDVREWDETRALVETVEESLGPIDVFVGNAGLRQVTVTNERGEPVPEIDVDVWNAVIETNLTGAFLCARAAIPGMLERGRGRMIFLASKFGLNGFCESLAYELEGTGVDALRLCPGGAVYTENLVESGQPADKFEHEPEVIR